MKNRLPKYPPQYFELCSDADKQQFVNHLKLHSKDQQNPKQADHQRRLVHFRIDGVPLTQEAVHQKHQRQYDHQRLRDQPLTQLFVTFSKPFHHPCRTLILRSANRCTTQMALCHASVTQIAASHAMTDPITSLKGEFLARRGRFPDLSKEDKLRFTLLQHHGTILRSSTDYLCPIMIS